MFNIERLTLIDDLIQHPHKPGKDDKLAEGKANV